jgi:hypothetical protein
MTMKFEVFMVVKMSMFIFWVVIPRGLGSRYQYLPTSSHGITTQKSNIDTQNNCLNTCDITFYGVILFHLYFFSFI